MRLANANLKSKVDLKVVSLRAALAIQRRVPFGRWQSVSIVSVESSGSFDRSAEAWPKRERERKQV